MSHEYCFTNSLSQPDGSQAPSSLAQKSEPGTHVFLQELGKIQSATLTTERKMILLYERCLTPTKHCVYNNKANQIVGFLQLFFTSSNANVVTSAVVFFRAHLHIWGVEESPRNPHKGAQSCHTRRQLQNYVNYWNHNDQFMFQNTHTVDDSHIKELGHTNLITGFWSKEISKIKQGTRLFFFSKPSIGEVKNEQYKHSPTSHSVQD